MNNKYEGEDSSDEVCAERYRKLRRWMSSNVKEGWEEIERMGAVAAWMGWDHFDNYLDTLPECQYGLCSPPIEETHD